MLLTAFAGSNAHIASLSALKIINPFDFAGAEAHQATLAQPTKISLTAEFTALNTTPAAVVSDANFAQNSLTLWDNLLFQHLSPQDSSLRDAIVRAIRWRAIATQIVANAISSNADVTGAVGATVLLPAGALPPFINGPSRADGELRTVYAGPARPDAGLLTRTRQTLTDVIILAQRQIVDEWIATGSEQFQVRGNSRDRNPTFAEELAARAHGWAQLRLDATRQAALSADGQAVLKGLGLNIATASVPQIREGLRQALDAGFVQDLRTRPQSRTLRTPGGLIHLDGVCTDFGAPDPCARYALKPLSFIPGRLTNYSIGDLRVVRSELLKYELGEIARTETVLVGETKTHTLRNYRRDEQDVVNEVSTETDTEKDCRRPTASNSRRKPTKSSRTT